MRTAVVVQASLSGRADRCPLVLQVDTWLLGGLALAKGSPVPGQESADAPPGPEWKDHPLKGDCHVGGDFLLIYKIGDAIGRGGYRHRRCAAPPAPLSQPRAVAMREVFRCRVW